MRRICLLVCLAAALMLPSVAGAAPPGWKPALSRTGEATTRLNGDLAVLARARASVKAPELSRAPELPRTGGDPGLTALAGLGLGLTGAGLLRRRPPL